MVFTICNPAESRTMGTSANQNLAFKLFSIYLFFYITYVMTNAFWPSVMETQFYETNLAIWSGFFLIIGAFVLAILYGWLATPEEKNAS